MAGHKPASQPPHVDDMNMNKYADLRFTTDQADFRSGSVHLFPMDIPECNRWANTADIDYVGWRYLEPLVEAVVPDFELYATTPVDRATWRKLLWAIRDFRQMILESNSYTALSECIGVPVHIIKFDFCDRFDEGKGRLLQLFDATHAWAEDRLRVHSGIVICGP